jgi:hypothetical protein
VDAVEAEPVVVEGVVAPPVAGFLASRVFSRMSGEQLFSPQYWERWVDGVFPVGMALVDRRVLVRVFLAQAYEAIGYEFSSRADFARRVICY